ncbi:MAG: class I SAM-dependent methyltransferase [Tenacibaculum sp.]|nr:class I SAM-dependent methyltransferase [Tenacibaculum sp.]
MELDPTNQFIKAILKCSNIKDKNILEIGCGSGRITKDLAKYAKSITAIDPDDNSLKIAKENLTSNKITFIKGLGEDLSFLKDKKFDVVIYSLSLHHIPYKAMELSLKQATELLNDNGKLIIIEPDKNGSLIKAEELFNVGDGDETFVKQKAIKAIKSLKNYEVIKKDYFNTLFYFNDEIDFLENMLPDYKTKPNNLISEIKKFLNEHKENDKITLYASRNINILKKLEC